MRILFAYKADPEGAKDPYTSLLPIGLGYLNATLREQGFESRVANFSASSWREIADIMNKERPDILGVSLFTHNRGASLKLVESAKKGNPACFTIAGGPHATHRAEELLSVCPTLDAVAIGEGEASVLELARTLSSGAPAGIGTIAGLVTSHEGRIVRGAARQPIADLDSLPIPARYMDDSIGVDLHRQLEFIVTSRGCPAACRFCSSPRFWGNSLRFRSPKAIVEEIRFIRDRYGLIYFSFRDDTFTADRQRVIELCRLLIEEKLYVLWNCQSRVNAVDAEMLGWMRRAGCECIQYGVESGSRQILDFLGKRITPEQTVRAAAVTRQAGINLSVYLITGVPGEDKADLQANLALIRELKAMDGQVSPLAYYPGTGLFENDVAAGLIPADMFERDPSIGFYIRRDRFAEESADAMLSALWKTAEKSRFDGKDHARLRRELGWCYAGSVMAGEYFHGEGDFKRAQLEFRDITVQEPENPWGWLKLGELYGDEGDLARSEEAFARLLSLVPNHAPAHAAMGELRAAAGDITGAVRRYQECLRLNPFDTLASKALRSLKRGGRK